MALYATNIWQNPTGLSFEFNFAGGYLDRNHIKVEAEHKVTGQRTALTFSLLNNYTVLLTSAVPANSSLWIYRETPVGVPLADFTNGTRVTEAGLDTATQQSLFAVAELYDRIALGLSGKGFTAATEQLTTTATAEQTVFQAPMYAPTDTVAVYCDQLRIHPTDVERTSSTSVTIPPRLAGNVVTVEVTRMLPIAQAPGGVSGGTTVTASNVGPGRRVFQTKVGDDLRFRTLTAGANITLTQDDAQIRISANTASTGAAPVTTALGSFVLNTSTPTEKIRIPTTDAGGWADGVGQCTLDFECVPTNYFAMNPGGHVAIITRCDTALLDTAVSGQGVIFGNMVGIGDTEGAPFPKASQIETWEYPDNPTNRWIFPDTSGGPGAPMADDQRYRFIVESVKNYDNQRYIRYRRYIWYPSRACWNLEVDSGHVLDHNVNSDLTKTGIAFGHVFSSGSGGWSVAFNNVNVTWGPAAVTVDQRANLQKTGGTVTGPVTLYRAAIRMDASGADPTRWAKVLPAADNDDAKWFVTPSKASGQGLLIAGNSNTGNLGYAALSASPKFATLNTGALGSADIPELRVGHGETAQMTFKSGGVYVGTRPKPLGNADIFADLQNAGGSAARAFANSGSPFNIESLCVAGGISGVMPATITNSALEAALRPVYCLLSTLIETTRSKGTA